MSLSLSSLWTSAAVLAQVVLIDLVLAGDNAVAVAMAATGLSPTRRRGVILCGLAAAAVMRVSLALVAVRLLKVVGLTLTGGLLLLLICWRMWRDLRGSSGAEPATTQAKSFGRALLQILLADLSMSLDNILAVAGAARAHPFVLVFGLSLSVLLTGAAASALSRLLGKAPWIGYLGLAIIIYVALRMIWDGAHGVVVALPDLRDLRV